MLQTDRDRLATRNPSSVTLAMKRTFDCVVSGVAIVLLSPVFILVAIAIKLDSPGPIFFRQARVGRGGGLFAIYKFRSMVVDAARLGTALTVNADPRITRIGAFLRDKKLDELPQLLNVFVGSMSFVGPRPEVPEYMIMYTPEQRDVILSMRPGITDYASIFYRDESSLLDGQSDPMEVYRDQIMPRKYVLYERYSREIGLLTDLRLILATVSLLISEESPDWFGIERDLTVGPVN